ncbi:hypothetical protein HNP84_006926 [Thermocatellispora tengchongensis]|uniref:Uncharacterized protein n=1 Tax=Thermocatellispora tengchongensis TaxID=1073253 RepID=A0A840P757_9ACTN|nr:hypothetical protein [Thermocatellispora tengchongensis]MBB5137174.1 hypothetical protein [Thermocatellispora tengchongensis]
MTGSTGGEPTQGTQEESAQGGESARGPGDWQTTALTALGFVADVAALGQLFTSGPLLGVLVTGILAALLGLGGLVRQYGRPLRAGGLAMAALIVVGSGTAGAALDRAWSAPAPAQPAADGPSSQRPTGASGSASSASSASPEPGAPQGDVVNTGDAVLADQDYLDLEGGVISEVSAEADIVYHAPYHEIWTKGGGGFWITPFSGTPTAAECARELRRRHYGSVRAEKNAWYCLETAERNVGALKVTDLPEREDRIAVHYIVWRSAPTG